jgi:histidinol-phosphate aminotransferase
MTVPSRPEIAAMTEAVHGGAAGSAIDFSSNINPYGASPRVYEALHGASFDCYPDRESTELRGALATWLRVSPENLIAGAGSSELLLWIALAYLSKGNTVLVVGLTYSEYARVSQLMGANVVTCDAVPETQFAVPIAAIEQALQELSPRILFLCRPNNPTGKSLPVLKILQWIVEFPETLFVIDEAYIEFSPAIESLVGHVRENLVVVRSMTKAFGLAGLRLGYAVAPASVIDALRRVRPPWSVATAAQVAGVAALQDIPHVDRSVQTLLAERDTIASSLSTSGLSIISSSTHFLLVRVGNAAHCYQQLLAAGIQVRDCTSMRLPEFVRISPQKPELNRELCEAFAKLG